VKCGSLLGFWRRRFDSHVSLVIYLTDFFFFHFLRLNLFSIGVILWPESCAECPLFSIPTSPSTRSEKWAWHCAYEPAFRRRIIHEMCNAIWWWRWLLPRTSQVAGKERTRTMMCYCGRTPVLVHVPVISAPRRCVGFIGRRRRRSPELNELKRSGARTHV